ncbi:MAG TPA: hypothetical protein VJ385_04350 [Fibrobacteria bacterium]|nr:hypothetical protein [Fibrobacteria bacterium]
MNRIHACFIVGIACAQACATPVYYTFTGKVTEVSRPDRSLFHPGDPTAQAVQPREGDSYYYGSEVKAVGAAQVLIRGSEDFATGPKFDSKVWNRVDIAVPNPMVPEASPFWLAGLGLLSMRLFRSARKRP